MKTIRAAIIAAAFMALILVFGGLVFGGKQAILAANKPDTVKYLPIPAGNYKDRSAPHHRRIFYPASRDQLDLRQIQGH